MKKNLLCSFAIYDCNNDSFIYDKSFEDVFHIKSDSEDLWILLAENNMISIDEAEKMRNIMKEAALTLPSFMSVDCCINFLRCNIGFMHTEPDKITITFNFSKSEDCQKCKSSIDELTGLLNQKAFLREISNILSLNEKDKYMIVYFDVQRFKVINDMFGMAEGDRLLKYIADVISKNLENNGKACRLSSDRFVFFSGCPADERERLILKILDDISDFDLPFEITCNAGAYIIPDEDILSSGSLISRAIIAQNSVKGSYTKRYAFYTEILRKNLLSEQEISGIMRTALKKEQFVVYYQPQYNHSTGLLVGAEALVRWIHPEKGMISPAQFIPVFEKNGFITSLDLYVFEKVCRFIRKCMDNNISVVPVSTNLTRYDIFSPDFMEKLEATRKKYDIPSKYVRVEITESAAIGNGQFINDAVRKLHGYGYIVEMDDFGSGYSSLNILKDIDFDIIKLDMKFLQKEKDGGNRGGTILSSVVRMVNWLGLPIIAEGVETTEQADFLGSIGCDYIQGYLYSKPLPEEQYLKILEKSFVGNTNPQMKLIDTLNAGNFWSSDSLETLIFSNFVGGAAIFDYDGENNIEILRVNKKYLAELGMNLSEKEIIKTSPFEFMEKPAQDDYKNMLQRAIDSNEEHECETWRKITSECCGEEKMCLRSTVRLIGQSKGHYLFHAMIRNITAEKNYYGSILESEKRFKIASEHANIYYWEYTIATKEMRPCFRCMRDLGMPPVLKNYPESAIEMGVFPPEVADMYRDFMRKIDNGAKELEVVVPLTVGRIPFRVKYTTEFDENDRPVKSYGSATLIVD